MAITITNHYKGVTDSMKSKSFFESKKVKAFLIGVVGLFLTQFVGLDEGTTEELMKAILTITGMYLGSQGGVDLLTSLKQPPVIDTPKTDDK